MQLIYKRHPLSLVNYDPIDMTTIIWLAVAAGAGAGAEALISSSQNKPKGPDAATPPDPNKAADAAKQAQLDQRKTFLASGGQTDYTGGLGVLTGADVSKSTLVGN